MVTIQHPVLADRDESGRLVLRQAYVFKEDLDDYRRFFEEIDGRWTLERARARTPEAFTPAGLTRMETGGCPHDVALSKRSFIEPPQLLLERHRARRTVYGLADPTNLRWFRRRRAESRGIDLARELRRARGAHLVLESVFGGHVREKSRFHVAAADHDQYFTGQLCRGTLPSSAWGTLSSALLRLVGFDRIYLSSRFGAFALCFAAITECGGKFFPQIAKVLATEQDGVRECRVESRRLAICFRAAYWAERVYGETRYPALRRLIAKVIENFEFLKHQRRRVSRESIYTWLRRQGW